MASYSNKNYTFEGLEVQVGAGFAFNMAGKYPLLTKRIFDTKAMAQAFVDDVKDSAIAGLTITVIADTADNNGVYFVKSIGDGTNAGVLEKLGASQGTSDVKDALDKLTAAVGANAVSAVTESLADTHYLSAATTDSVIDALKALDTALDNVQTELTKANLTAGTVNDVEATISHDAAGTSFSVTVDGGDVKVGDGFTPTTYNDRFEGATAVKADDTIETAFHSVESTINELATDVIALADELDATQTGAGLASGGTYVQVASANYISGATSLADADTKLDTALKAVQDQVTANKIASADESIIVTNAASGTDLSVNLDEATLVQDETSKKIKATLKLTACTADEVAALGTNVKEAYKLVDKDGTKYGDDIKIYKDASLIEVYLGSSADTIDATTGDITKETVTDPQSLNFKYELADGTFSLVKIDVSKFLTESEFASGVTATAAGVVTGVVDTTSEEFLTVGANGFKLSGVQEAIDEAAASATTVVEHNADDKNITVTSATAADGHVTYTVNETGLTPAADANYVKAANTVAANLGALDTALNTVSGEVDTAESAIGLATDGTHVTTTGNYTSAATTIVGEIAALDTELKALNDEVGDKDDATITSTTVWDAISEVKAAATTEVDHAADNINITVTSAQDPDTKATTYTVNESGLTLDADKNYVKVANTVAANLGALDTAVKQISGDSLSGAVVNNVTGTVANNVVTVTIDGGDIEVGDYTAATQPTGWDNDQIESTDTVPAALKKLDDADVAIETRINALESNSAHTIVELGEVNGNLKLESAETGSLVTYTLSDLGLTPEEDKNYVKATNTVAVNLEALDTNLKTLSDVETGDRLTAATVNGVAATVTSASTGTNVVVSIKGSDIEVASSYTQTVYPTEFDSKATKVSASSKVDVAFQAVEKTISALTQEVLDNEQTTADAISAITEAAGIVLSPDGEISYNEHDTDSILSAATSLDSADVELANAVRAAQAAATTVVTEKASDPISVTSAQDATTKATTYTVGLDYVSRTTGEGADSAGATLIATTDGDVTKLDIQNNFDFGTLPF